MQANPAHRSLDAAAQACVTGLLPGARAPALELNQKFLARTEAAPSAWHCKSEYPALIENERAFLRRRDDVSS